MKVEIKEIEELVRELSIKIPAEVANKEMEKMFSELCRNAAIKGFRKGKAPMNIIKSKYGDEVKADVADQLIRSSYPKAIEENLLKVASQPTVTNLNFDDEGAFQYTAKVEVMPGIDAIDFSNLEVTAIDMQVKDEDVDALAQTVRTMFAEFRHVDREIRSDDVMVADLKKVYDPGLVLKSDLINDVEIDLAKKSTVKEFKEQLPGMKVGDEKEIEVMYGDDYPDSAFAGACIRYNCKVKEVKERILPEFDDSLAKRTGKAETALELRLKLREDIERQQASDLRRVHKSQIIRQVCEQNRIPIPESMVSDYLNAIVEEEKSNDPALDEEEVRKSSREVAVNTLRWNMLYHHIAEQEKIEVSSSDTDQMIEGLAGNYNMTFEQAKQALERSGKIASIRDTMLEEKVLDFLIGKAKAVPLDKKKKT